MIYWAKGSELAVNCSYWLGSSFESFFSQLVVHVKGCCYFRCWMLQWYAHIKLQIRVKVKNYCKVLSTINNTLMAVLLIHSHFIDFFPKLYLINIIHRYNLLHKQSLTIFNQQTLSSSNIIPPQYSAPFNTANICRLLAWCQSPLTLRPWSPTDGYKWLLPPTNGGTIWSSS